MKKQRSTWSHVRTSKWWLFFFLFRLRTGEEDDTSQPSLDPAVLHPVQECKGGLKERIRYLMHIIWSCACCFLKGNGVLICGKVMDVQNLTCCRQLFWAGSVWTKSLILTKLIFSFTLHSYLHIILIICKCKWVISRGLS